MSRAGRLASVLLFALAGCGDGKVPVEGTVALDGNPVAEGAVLFVKSDGTAREGGGIRDGKFEARLAPGTYRVELNARKVVGTRRQKGFDGKEEVLEITDELFPERFNAKSTLTEEIRPGPNVLRLDLKSKK